MLTNNVKLYNNIKLDFFHIEDATGDNLDIFNNVRFIPVLNNYSRFLVTFDDGTTTAQGIADEALGYTFSIYREVEGTNNLIYVARLDEGSLSVTDYGVVNNTNYRYYIFQEDDSAVSEAVISNNVQTCWWDWSLVDLIPSDEDNLYYVDDSNIWKFDLNLSSASMTNTMSATVYDSLAQYPKVSVSNTNYSTGGITCLLGSISRDGSSALTYQEPAVLMDLWKAFCSNGRMKLLKDRKGNAYLVAITSNSSQIDDILSEQPNTITFNWVQVGDISNTSVVGM